MPYMSVIHVPLMRKKEPDPHKDADNPAQLPTQVCRASLVTLLHPTWPSHKGADHLSCLVLPSVTVLQTLPCVTVLQAPVILLTRAPLKIMRA